MKQGIIKISLALMLAFFLGSCSNYYISLSSLKQQFNGIDSTKLKEVTVETPFGGGLLGGPLHYKANPITTIQCTDKNGTTFGLKNGPSIEMRVTYGYKNNRKVFFFDRVFLTSTSLIGAESRLIGGLLGTIPLDSIKKIEVQDGHKKYSYQNN
jgi:hypothetical protein